MSEAESSQLALFSQERYLNRAGVSVSETLGGDRREYWGRSLTEIIRPQLEPLADVPHRIFPSGVGLLMRVKNILRIKDTLSRPE